MTSKIYALNSGYTRLNSSINCIRFGTCEILPRTREVFANGQSCSVEPKVFDLLLYLINERNRVVSKEELLEQIWKGAFVSESVIARTIMKARKTVGDRMPDSPFIKTIHCVGYRFIPAVDIFHDEDLPPASSLGMEYVSIPEEMHIKEDITI